MIELTMIGMMKILLPTLTKEKYMAAGWIFGIDFVNKR